MVAASATLASASSRRLSRPSWLSWYVVDGTAVVVMLLITSLEVWVAEDRRPLSADHKLVVYGLLFVLVSSVLFRRRFPVATSLVAMAAAAGTGLLGFSDQTCALFAALILVYSAAAYVPRPQQPIIAAVCVGGVFLHLYADLFDGHGFHPDPLTAYVFFGGAWVVGELHRRKRADAEAVSARASTLEQDNLHQQELAARALADERTRIARELHDVVAHNMSVVVVQAGAARFAAGTDPEHATAALASIEATGREALVEMRRLLGVLRALDDDAADGLAPAPGVERIPELVANVCGAGLPVELHIDGAARAVTPGASLSAYRIVQEGLTNVLKHAGASRTTVRLRYEPEGLAIEVRDDGSGVALAVPAPTGAGHGLVGMRERAAIVGGALDAGTDAGGGYVVRGYLPFATR